MVSISTDKTILDNDGAPEHILKDRPGDTPGHKANETGSKPLPPEDKPSKYPPHGKGSGRGNRDHGQRVAFYIYEDARSRYYLGVERTTTKVFPQYHWDGKQWIRGLPDGFLKIPYRLPELLDAPSDAWVVIAAGEKDTETAVCLGFVATTNPGGEGKGQWTPELNKWFAGKKRVAIMEDNDKAGHAHAIEVANALRGIVPDIRIVQFRELKAGGDLTDWAEADPAHDHAALLARIEGSQPATGYDLVRASAVVRRAVQWWWPGHLARGELEILTGIPDIGKSQIHCSYVATMTTGRDWPNKAKGPPACDVVMLTAEDNTAHTVCPRLAAAGADLDRVHILSKIRKDNKNRMFMLQEDLDVLEHILASNPNIGLVTIDPITAYLGGKLDSHRATDVRNQLGPLKDLAERCHVAFSAITHPAKRPGTRALDHYICSQAFIAAPRLGHIAIPEFEEGEDGKPRATGRFLFATPKHNIYVAMPTIAYRLVTASGGCRLRDRGRNQHQPGRVGGRGQHHRRSSAGRRSSHYRQDPLGRSDVPARHAGQRPGRQEGDPGARHATRLHRRPIAPRQGEGRHSHLQGNRQKGRGLVLDLGGAHAHQSTTRKR
jgi:hypothetical protein